MSIWMAVRLTINYILVSKNKKGGNYVNPKILIYDLKSISETNAMTNVFRVLLQFAEKFQSKNIDVVELSFESEIEARSGY